MPVAQPPSRYLSRIPRELRDEIYAYSLQEPGGNIYSPVTNQLQYYDSLVNNLNLTPTYKWLADEMQTMPLTVNGVVSKPVQEATSS
jgi:hypothetical protein